MTIVLEAALVLHALFYSVFSMHRVAAAFFGAVGLVLAAHRGATRESLFIFLPLAIGAALSISSGAAPGPSWEAAGVLAGAYGWFVAGRMEFPLTPKRGGQSGRLAALAAVLLSIGAVAETLTLHRPPRLWMTSPLDLGVALVILGAIGSTAFARSRALALYLIVIALGAAFISSRGVLLGAGVVILILWPGSLRAKLIVVGILAAVGLPILLPRLLGDPLAWSRPRIWSAALSLIEERPWTGWGLGSFESVSRRALLADLLPIRRLRIPLHAHCDPLELLAEIGLPLGCAALAGFSLCGVALWKNRALNRLAVFLAALSLSLFYFPFQLAWPLFVLSWAAGGGVHPSRPRSSSLWLYLPALALLVYALGIMTHDSELARWDGRLALERHPDFDGVSRLIELEPSRPEAHVNMAIYSAGHGSSGGAIRAFSRAVGLAPTETPLRFELVRAWRWHAALVSDTADKAAAVRIADEHLGFIRAVEPLTLAAHRGDTVAQRLAAFELEMLERAGENKEHLNLLRRSLDEATSAEQSRAEARTADSANSARDIRIGGEKP